MPQMSPLYWEVLFFISIMSVTGVLVKFFFMHISGVSASSSAFSYGQANSFHWLW